MEEGAEGFGKKSRTKPHCAIRFFTARARNMMKLATRCMQTLDEGELQQIWETALRVWERVPLRVQGTDEFMELVRGFGCNIEGDRISFPDDVRDKTLAAIAEVRRTNGPMRPAEVTDVPLTYSASGQALYCCDVDTEQIRPATTDDLARFSWVCDMFPHLGRAHPTFIPQDVPAGSADVHAFATIILNSTRPWRVSVYDADMLPFFMELQAVCDENMEKVQRNPVFAAKVWVNSPFMITRENIEIGMKARELLGQPLVFNTMPVAGIATPATLAGALATIAAEVLACNVLSLAVDNRVCGWIAGPLTFDMKTGIHTQTGPDVQLLRLGASQMAAYMFGGEYRGVGGPTTAAKTPGEQAAMEKALDTMWAICAGARDFGSLAVLAFADIGSVTQLMMDLELMSHYERLLEGITVDPDRLAEELIAEITPKGAYFLNQEHTVRYYRSELWIPELMDRRVAMAWQANPVSMLDTARKKARQVMAEAQNQCPLSDEQKASIMEIVQAADTVAADKRKQMQEKSRP